MRQLVPSWSFDILEQFSWNSDLTRTNRVDLNLAKAGSGGRIDRGLSIHFEETGDGVLPFDANRNR